LHKGTTLTRLLHENKLTSCPISPQNLHQFEFLSPFNAMIELGEIKIDINAIHP
ncbi:MAG: 4-amino-4-deoxychorismate lyase, partial [Prevotella nanceiensis]|nr:4-amino-4-deoxychorismate lyase [Hoylesella nanceiensis]